MDNNQTLSSQVNESLLKMANNGTIQEMIDTHTKKMLNESISSLLGWGSDFKKAVDQHLKENIIFKPENIDLASYNEFIALSLSQKLSAVLGEQSAKTTDEIIKHSLGLAVVPAEMTVDEFLQKIIENGYKDAIDSSDVEYDPTAYIQTSLYIEKKENITFIKFDLKPDIEKYSCQESITLDSAGVIIGVRAKISGSIYEPLTQFLLNCKYQGVKIRGITRSISEESYPLDVHNFIDHCGC